MGDLRESVIDAASNKEGAIDRADFERLAAAIKEEAVADYEAKQAMVAKLGRSKNRVRYFGAAAGCLVLSIGLLIPILLGILQLSKDTFIEAAGADGAPTMVARDGRGVEVGQAASLSSLADLPDAADPTAFESLQSLIYTAEDGRVISDRVVGWEWSKPGNATRLVVRTERSVALVEHGEVATQGPADGAISFAGPTVDDAVPAALASEVHAAAAAATCASAGCALDRCAVRVKGASKAATCDGITVWEWPSGVSLAGQAEAARRRRLQMGGGGSSGSGGGTTAWRRRRSRCGAC